jgi:MFS family permease
MLGPVTGGLIVDYLHWRYIFFINIPIGLAGLILVNIHLPDFREPDPHPLDFVGLILFGSGIALLSYVLEIFGEHTLGSSEIFGLLAVSLALLLGYWLHARSLEFPLLQLRLFAVRTFRAAVSGSFFTRLGIGGVPFLLPLLYQVGLGYSPVESGLLIMPQALAAMSLKMLMVWLIRRVGYRAVLISNTIIIGVLLCLFATIGTHTSVWFIVLLAFCYGAFTSLQYTSMNTLTYADVPDEDASMASSIASTAQQLSISFGVAIAGITTALFVPASASLHPNAMIEGIHRAFLFLGVLTVLSTLVFRTLKAGDGGDVSNQRSVHPGG